MEQFPRQESIREALNSAWGLRDPIVPVPRTKRLFSVSNGKAKLFVRMNWARGMLSAMEVVEFVNHLSRTGAPVPQIVPTRSGDLCVSLDDSVVLSVETDIGGNPCSSVNLEALEAVGSGLAQIHLASGTFTKCPVRDADLKQLCQVRLRRALSRKLPEDLHGSISRLEAVLESTHCDLVFRSVPWMTTHGDVWGHNVHFDSGSVSFTDVCCSFAPAITDLVMIHLRWLMNDTSGNGRPLETEEMLDVLRGYQSRRPLTATEVATFGIVWSVYCADKLSHFVESPRAVSEPLIGRWDLQGEIRRLPQSLSRMGSLLFA